VNARIISIVSAAGIAGILALGWFLGVSPQLNELVRVDTAIAQAQQQNRDQEAALARLESASADLDARRAELAALDSELPRIGDTESFADTVGRIAAENGLVLQALSFGEGELFGAGEAGAGAGAEGAPDVPPGLVSVAVTITAEGSQEGGLALLQQLQQGERVFLVNQASSSDQGAMSISGYVFVLLDEVPAPASEPDDVEVAASAQG